LAPLAPRTLRELQQLADAQARLGPIPTLAHPPPATAAAAAAQGAPPARGGAGAAGSPGRSSGARKAGGKGAPEAGLADEQQQDLPPQLQRPFGAAAWPLAGGDFSAAFGLSLEQVAGLLGLPPPPGGPSAEAAPGAAAEPPPRAITPAGSAAAGAQKGKAAAGGAAKGGGRSAAGATAPAAGAAAAAQPPPGSVSCVDTPCQRAAVLAYAEGLQRLEGAARLGAGTAAAALAGWASEEQCWRRTWGGLLARVEEEA
jgi:hypothetical protein